VHNGPQIFTAVLVLGLFLFAVGCSSDAPESGDEQDIRAFMADYHEALFSLSREAYFKEWKAFALSDSSQPVATNQWSRFFVDPHSFPSRFRDPDTKISVKIEMDGIDALFEEQIVDNDYPKGARYQLRRSTNGWRIASEAAYEEDPADDLPMGKRLPASAFFDRLPEPLEEVPLDYGLAFQPSTIAWLQNPVIKDGKTRWEHQPGPLTVQGLGEVEIPSGTLMMCDPGGIGYESPCPLRIPKGKHPVDIVRAPHEGRPVILRVRFDPRPAVRHVVLKDRQGHAYGIGVDGGSAAVVDAERAMTSSRNEVRQMLLSTRSDAGYISNDPFRGVNVISCMSGWGDGGYPVYAGVTADNDPVELIAVFMMLAKEPETASFEVPMPEKPQRVPLGVLTGQKGDIPLTLILKVVQPPDYYDFPSAEELRSGKRVPREQITPPPAMTWQVVADLPSVGGDNIFYKLSLEWFENPDRKTPSASSSTAVFVREYEDGDSALPLDCVSRGGVIRAIVTRVENRFYQPPGN